jgi:hypothetical protein
LRRMRSRISGSFGQWWAAGLCIRLDDRWGQAKNALMTMSENR